MQSPLFQAAEKLYNLVNNHPFDDMTKLKEQVEIPLAVLHQCNVIQNWKQEYCFPTHFNQLYSQLVTKHNRKAIRECTRSNNKHHGILAAKLIQLEVPVNYLRYLFLNCNPQFHVVIEEARTDYGDELTTALIHGALRWRDCLEAAESNQLVYNAFVSAAVQDIMRAMTIWLERDIETTRIIQSRNLLLKFRVNKQDNDKVTSSLAIPTTPITTTITNSETAITTININDDNHTTHTQSDLQHTSEMTMDNKINDEADLTTANTPSLAPSVNSNGDANASTTDDTLKTEQFLGGDRGGISTVTITAREDDNPSQADEEEQDETVSVGDIDEVTSATDTAQTYCHEVTITSSGNQQPTAASNGIHQGHDRHSVISTPVTIDYAHEASTISTTVSSNDLPMSSIVQTHSTARTAVKSTDDNVSSIKVTEENRAIALSSTVVNTANVITSHTPAANTSLQASTQESDTAISVPILNDPANKSNTSNHNAHVSSKRDMDNERRNKRGGNHRNRSNTTSYYNVSSSRNTSVGTSHIASLSNSHTPTPVPNSAKMRNNRHANTSYVHGTVDTVVKSVRFVDNNNQFAVLSEDNDTHQRKTLKPGHACIWDIVYDGIKPTGAKLDTRAVRTQQANNTHVKRSMSPQTHTKMQQQTHTHTHTHRTPVVRSHNNLTNSTVSHQNNSINTVVAPITNETIATKSTVIDDRKDNKNNNATKSIKANNKDNLPLNAFLAICSKHYFAFQRQKQRNYKTYAKQNKKSNVTIMPINTKDDSIYNLCANVINSADYKQALATGRA